MTNTADTLTTRKLGTRWTKTPTLDRVYLTDDTIHRLGGVRIDTYNTGNIQHFTALDESHANGRAYPTQTLKVWFDVPTAQWQYKHAAGKGDDIAEAVAKRVIAAVEAEIAPTPEPEPAAQQAPVTAEPATDPDPVFITTEREYRNAREYLLDHMDGFDPAVYRADIPRAGLDKVALDDWECCWTQGDEVHHTEDAALAATGYGSRYQHVLTLHLDDVRDVLRERFVDA